MNLRRWLPFSWAVLIVLAGCDPKGTREEREAADARGKAYAVPRTERELPALSEPLAVDDLLRHAFLANAALEADYHLWRQALERIPQASSWDQPQLSFKYLTSSGVMRTWDRTTLEVSQAIPIAGKLGLKKDAALAEALAARGRFENAKFMLQARVLSAAADYGYLGEAIAAQAENLRLLEYVAELAAARLKVGMGRQEDLLKAQVEVETAENELKMLQAQRPAQGAALNALLGREASLPLSFPAPEAVAPVTVPDADLIRLAAERNPELAAMAEEVRGRNDALAYARRAWVPDLTLGYEVMGDISASLTGMLTLPLRAGRIRAAVREARAATAEAEARRLGAGDDLKARVVIALAMLRDADRQIGLYAGSILPKAEQALAASIAGYGAAGGGDFLDVLDIQRTLLETRLALARAVAGRAKALSELEAAVAMDHGTWGKENKEKAP